MKKLFCLFPLLCLPLFSAQPNVPLYVHWDGTIAAPTQFLSATFKAGANMVFVDNRTNLTISATTGVGSNSVVIIPGTNIVVTTNITGTNIIYTVSTSTGVGSNSVVVAPGTSVTVTTNATATNVIYTVSSSGSSITNIGALCTNVAYTTNLGVDFSYLYNDYYMTNSLTNHINVRITNLVAGTAITLSISAPNVFTNYNVYFSWPVSATVTWLSITNGIPVAQITSNKVQFYSFLVRSSSTTTNVIAAFKEQP